MAQEKEEKTFTKIMVEVKGKMIVNITDLPKEQYEEFLKLVSEIKMVYELSKHIQP